MVVAAAAMGVAVVAPVVEVNQQLVVIVGASSRKLL